jgi:DNA polymerase IIIc chi subunit
MLLEFFDLERIGMDSRQALAWLAEKYLAEGKVLIWAEDWQQAQELDQWLWTYSPSSFLPHGLDNAADAALEPILISSKLHNRNQAATLLLAFTPRPASWLPPAGFARSVELIPRQDGPERGICRARYAASGKFRQYTRLYTNSIT